ncbi:MAG: GNAT family protein [Anaerolineae bacterium]|nr:GNAT family N-acetyltransferase [Thermoflexales bacterium]MDW8394705.1 GNAT family protein [Anaerolineae bacterium]
MEIHPVELHGRTVCLKPLQLAHAEPLWTYADDPDIWRYMPYGTVDTLDKLVALIQDLLSRQARGTDLCFTVFYLPTGEPIGMTRYLSIERAHRNLEIGGTWYGRPFRSTLVNRECKYLLLRYAFETLGCVRVQLKADLRNERSQRAIERLGAVREGVLRKHMIMPDGYTRSSVIYSILDEEWPMVKARLEADLAIGV